MVTLVIGTLLIYPLTESIGTQNLCFHTNTLNPVSKYYSEPLILDHIGADSSDFNQDAVIGILEVGSTIILIVIVYLFALNLTAAQAQDIGLTFDGLVGLFFGVLYAFYTCIQCMVPLCFCLLGL